MKYLSWICLVLVPFFLSGCKKDKSAFENRIYYEYKTRWYWTNKYVEITVPVAIEDRVPVEFITITKLYDNVGTPERPKYQQVSVRVVNVKAFRVMEERRKEMLENMFWFFMIIAAGGFVAFLVGLVCLYKQFFLWDELVVGGGIAGPFGLVSAWYVDSLPIICTVFVACVVSFALYMIWTRRNNHKKKNEHKAALAEVVDTVEMMKSEAIESWDSIKPKIKHSETTRELVSRLKVENLSK